MSEPCYSISILCHNREALTRRCLASVLAHSPADAEIIVTDNGSRDGTALLLEDIMAADPRVHVYRNEQNMGITHAKNQALAVARAPLFVSLDNDATVAAGWLDSLRAPLDADPLVAQVGRAGQYQSLLENGAGTPHGQVEYIDGSCFMTRTAVAREIGLCDPSLPFAYCEDADYSLRLRLRGLKLAVVDAPVDHPRDGDGREHGGVEVQPIYERQHATFVSRWGYYLKTKRFDARVCVRRSGAIGDVILATPLPRLIKGIWPEARVVVATACPEVFTGNPYIAEIIPPEAAPACDYLFDLDGLYEADPLRPIWDCYVGRLNHDSLIRVPDAPCRPELYQQDPAPMPDRQYLVLHLEPTAWPGRNIPERLWGPIVDALHARGFALAVVGGMRSPSVPGLKPPDIQHRGLTLAQLHYLMRRSAGFVGIDSAPMHVAQACGKPVAAAFGCIDPALRLMGRRSLPVRARSPLTCWGCHHRLPAPRTSWGGCERGDLACMETLDPDDFVTTIQRAIGISETSKIRERVLPYLAGHGLDLGCGRPEIGETDKVLPDAIGVDAGAGVDVRHDLNLPLPFPDGGMDYAFSAHCLEHLHDWRTALRDWLRVLKPGGILALYLPHRDYYDNAWNADHKHAFDGSEIETLLLGQGAEILVDELDVDDVPLAERPERHYQTERYSFLIVAKKEDSPAR